MQLLVLTDFSPAADHALAYADSLAARLGAGLVLLHVQRTSPLDPAALTGTLSPLSEGEIAVALAQRSASLTVPALVEATAARVPEATQAAVRRHQPALLIVGKSAAADASPEVVAHTTALELLHSIECPILLVPEHTLAPVPPRRVSIAADDQPFSPISAATSVSTWLQQLSADFTVVHVAEPEDNDSAVTAHQQVTNSGLLPPATTLHQHGVRSLSIADGILQATQETAADLLIVQARHHNWLGNFFHRSVTAQLVRRTTLPVLIVAEAK